MTTENLLVEIGTEELPPKSLRKLATAFADNLTEELKALVDEAHGMGIVVLLDLELHHHLH